MNIFQVILEIILEGLGVAKKAIPPDEIRIPKFEIKKPKITANQKQIMLRESRIYLRLHPKQTVDTHVELKYDAFDDDDKEDMRKALYELFPKRKHKK